MRRRVLNAWQTGTRRYFLIAMPPYLHGLGTKDRPWSKFSLWLRWYAGRSRRWRGAGIAEAFSAPRAASDAARAARLREPASLLRDMQRCVTEPGVLP